MEGRAGHVHQAQGTYDPMTNQWVDAPEGTVAHMAGDRSRQDEQDWANAKTGIHLKLRVPLVLVDRTNAQPCWAMQYWGWSDT